MELETRVFRQNQFKNIALFLGCSTFVTIGYIIIDKNPIAAWSCISFFGIGIIVSVIQFFPNSSSLTLTAEGFETKGLFRSHFTKWSEVKNFRIGKIRGNKMIFFDYTDKHKKWETGKSLAKYLSGNEGAIRSTYNISSKELIKLMKEYKSKRS